MGSFDDLAKVGRVEVEAVVGQDSKTAVVEAIVVDLTEGVKSKPAWRAALDSILA